MIKDVYKRQSHDIEKFGIKILRFTNNEVFTDLKKINRDS